MFKEYKTLGPYFKKYLLRYVVGLFFLIITNAGQIIIPQFIKGAINVISAGDFLTNGSAMDTIMKSVMGIILVAIVVAVGRFGWRFFIHGASRRIEASLRHRIYTHLLTLSTSFFNKTKTGDLMARATNDMNAVRMATGMAMISFFDGLFMMTAILIILFSQYPQIALFAILPLPIITMLVLFFGPMIMKWFKKVQEGFSTITEQTQEAFSGVRVIKSYVKEQRFFDKFKEANLEYRRRNMALVRLWGFFFPIIAFLSGITQLILLRFGGIAVIEEQISTGDFVAIMSYLGMLIWPMIGAGFTVNILQRGAASLQRINKVLDEKPDIESPPGGLKDIKAGDIKIENLGFTYDGAGIPALMNINLTIKKGGTTGILGRTGSGKSTLLKLLPRLIDFADGKIFIDNTDIRKYDLNSLRALFCIVPQDPFLFSDTIHNNIAFGVDREHDELVRKVADISTITRDLANFPEGWETEIGERGVTLSGGQKQRITIARALALQSEILLFDDALSSVDTETEEQILRELMKFREGKTNIIISHRISTLRISDHILVMEKGEITQEGTHEELIKVEGLYSEIYAIQKLEATS